MNKEYSYIKPNCLCKGDVIGIIAPASAFDIDNFKKGVKKLRALGYHVKYNRSIFNKCWSRWGHNKQRGMQINRMFADNDVKAIFCAKAGYGSADILPYLDETIIRENPKIFIGYSDITYLLLCIQKLSGMVVFHGPVVSDEIFDGMNPVTLGSLVHMISECRPFKKQTYEGMCSLKPGKATGMLVGGNISLIADTIETSYRIEADNKILFLEDIGEDPEDLRRYLGQMKNAGIFNKIKGLMLGRMIRCFEDKNELKDVFCKMFAEINIPIVYNFPAGHTETREQPHITLPFGARVSIDADKLTVSIDEAAVK